jgi:hypothetical protein
VGGQGDERRRRRRETAAQRTHTRGVVVAFGHLLALPRSVGAGSRYIQTSRDQVKVSTGSLAAPATSGPDRALSVAPLRRSSRTGVRQRLDGEPWPVEAHASETASSAVRASAASRAAIEQVKGNVAVRDIARQVVEVASVRKISVTDIAGVLNARVSPPR